MQRDAPLGIDLALAPKVADRQDQRLHALHVAERVCIDQRGIGPRPRRRGAEGTRAELQPTHARSASLLDGRPE
ncbi:MAG: hypothetical protein ACK55I_04995, partial [bacterium]